MHSDNTLQTLLNDIEKRQDNGSSPREMCCTLRPGPGHDGTIHSVDKRTTAAVALRPDGPLVISLDVRTLSDAAIVLELQPSGNSHKSMDAAPQRSGRARTMGGGERVDVHLRTKSVVRKRLTK